MNTKRALLAMAAGACCACMAAAAEDIPLPPPPREGGATLIRALAERRSERTFDERALSPTHLSGLLWAAFGENRPGEGKRTAPSARNWQEIDVYAALPSGLYLYDAPGHRLQFVSGDDLRAQTGRQAFAARAPVCLVYVADVERMTGVTDEEALVFYSAVDTGFISQNVYLYCAANDLHTVVLGWVDKEGLARAMNLRPTQRVILTQPVGYPPSPDPDPEEALRDGEFEGSARGYDDEIVVRVAVHEGRLESLRVVSENESRPRRAFTDLPERIVEAQGSGGVDAVSGATVTSRALFEAVERALERSRGKE